MKRFDPGSFLFKHTISATITDAEDGVQGATLNYRKTGNSQYVSIAMIKEGGTYSATIPAVQVSLAGIEYYISATDGNNSATDPADQNQPHSIAISEKTDDDDDDGSNVLIWLLFIFLIVLFAGILTVNMWSDKFGMFQSKADHEPKHDEVQTTSDTPNQDDGTSDHVDAEPITKEKEMKSETQAEDESKGADETPKEDEIPPGNDEKE